MQNPIVTSGVDQESHLTPDPAAPFVTDGWVDMNSFHQPTTMPEYAGFSFLHISHGLPSESLARLAVAPAAPPPAQPLHAPQPHPQLQMLMMNPAPTAWPSMLTNPAPPTYAPPPPPQAAPPVPIPPIPAPIKKSGTGSQPRKTLTDEDRRRMCQYAEENPGAKQTDIGARFGVERSTVSKVLRNKDKYLNQDDRSSSPIRRPLKGKGVDIEKALSNWVTKAQKSGHTVTRDELKEKLRMFAATQSVSDSVLKSSYNSAWLDKFMLRHNINPGRLLRRASETNITDSMRSSGSPLLPASQPSSAISPTSPSGQLSPPSLPATKNEEDKDGMNNIVDFTNGLYKNPNTQSTTSLSSAFTDTSTPPFPGGAISPTNSFNFSPDPNTGAFQVPVPGPGFQRPRSQTFPTLDMEYLNQTQSADANAKFPPSATPSSALDSAGTEPPVPSYTFEPTVSSPRLRHSSSNSSIAGRGTTTPITNSAVTSSPASPTQEDAFRAADTLLSYLRSSNGLADQTELKIVMRLTEKLRIHQSKPSISVGIGGLSRIPEGDNEMASAPPVMKMETTMSA